MAEGKLEWVQALRGIAVLMVVVTHARYMLLGTTYQAFAETYMRPGAMGVDLFFLISGFIMVYTTRRSGGSVLEVAQFAVKRFARIWPVYAAVIAFGLATTLQISALPKASWVQLAMSLAFIPVDPRAPPYFNLPYAIGWTLNFEIYFYLVFALSMLAGRLRWVAFFTWMLLTLVAIPLAVTGNVAASPDHDYHLGWRYLDQMANPVIWDFVVGVAIGLLYHSMIRIKRLWITNVLLFISIAFVIWWAAPTRATFHGIGNWGLSLAIFFAIAALIGKETRITPPALIVWVGEISFSVYLFHIIVLAVIRALADTLGLANLVSTPVTVIVAIGLSLVYGAIANYFLERRLSEFVKHKLLRALNRTPHGRHATT